MSSTVITASAKALHSLRTPGMGKVLAISAACTALALLLFIGLVGGVAAYFASSLETSWLASLITVISAAGSGVVAWFLFPALMPIAVSLFEERIARLIERHEYPDEPHGKEAPLMPGLWHDIRFGLMALLLNLLLLPLYLIPVVNLVVYYWLNGYLLGRAFFVIVAQRHMPRVEAESFRRQHKRKVFFSGVLLAFLATLPFGNILAPFCGIAQMVHLFYLLRKPAIA